MLAILIFILVGLGFVHYLVHHDRRGKIVNKIPGPRSLPILGNLLTFMVPQRKNFFSRFYVLYIEINLHI